jgi:glycosyltransferase involved in cell wall biosynthesis
MKLHTVIVTHNRLHLTQQVIETYLATVTVPYSYIVVDNASTDGTQKWLKRAGHPALLLKRNFYPGYACNRGWEMAPDDATHLHRADNDHSFLPGWCDEVTRGFRSNRIGQLGLRTNAEEFNAPHNVGGNNIITRKLWERGLRYDERPWTAFDPGMSEDSYFSPAVKRMGFRWARVTKPCLVSLASGDWNDPYYKKAYGDRRIIQGTLHTDKEKRPRGRRR